MAMRKLIPELLQMTWYKTSKGKFFYAWSADHAIRKHPKTKLFVITDYGEEVHVRGTYDGDKA